MMNQSDENLIASEEPLFNIGAVARMTDIPEATLRVWERRYDFPNSSRTAGGHRLYSRQEVARLQWVKLRIDDGMQVSQAIRALQQVESELGGLRAEGLPQPFAHDAEAGDALTMFRQRLLEALLAHETKRANQVLAEALVLFPLEYLILDVIGPVLGEIGNVWAEGNIDVATEHFATNHLRHHLLMWMRSGPPAYQVSPVLLACAPGELHEGSLLMLAVLLRRLRWPVIYLGQTTPLLDLTAFVRDLNPAIVVFVAMTEKPALALAEWPRWLPDAAKSKQPIVTFGGRIFMEQPEMAEDIPGTWLGATLQEGIQALDRMLHDLNPLLR